MFKDEHGAHDFPLIVIFGVFIAFLLTLIFVNIYSQQLGTRVEEQAEDLVEDLTQTAFQSFTSGSLSTVSLPTDIGGSPYTLEVLDNSAFLVTIISGQKAGSEYLSVSTVQLSVENSDFKPGGTVYFLRAADNLIVSSSTIQYSPTPLPTQVSTTPPDFYEFAKENGVEAAGLAEAFFTAMENYQIDDLTGYWWEGDNLLVKISLENGSQVGLKVNFVENSTSVGVVENAMIISEMVESAVIDEVLTCPSLENAWLSGWFYSPSDVLNHLSSRTWRRSSDNSIVSVPGNAEISAAAVTTNVSTYPTWRVTFPGYIIYYRAMPWWELENTPGFLFQSSPELIPVL